TQRDNDDRSKCDPATLPTHQIIIDPASRLVHLRQGDLPIEDYVGELCELHYQVDFNETFLKDTFRYVFSKEISCSMPRNTPHWTLEQYIDFALQLSGSALTVGVADEGPFSPAVAPMSVFSHTRTVMLGIVCATPEAVHKMAVSMPDPLHKMAAIPRPVHKMAAKSESSHVMPVMPESPAKMTTMPRHDRKMAATPESPAKMATTSEPHHKMATLPESHHVMAAVPESHQVSADIPESAPVMTALPNSAPAIAALPESAPVMATLPEPRHITTTIPEPLSLQPIPYDRPIAALVAEPLHDKLRPSPQGFAKPRPSRQSLIFQSLIMSNSS
ncbi:hypothetical protein M9458_025926, partial [Cirrhinus mrigala]